MIGSWPSVRLCAMMSADVVGGVHEVVEARHPDAGHGGERDGDLAVVDGGGGQHAGDGDPPSATSRCSL